MSRARRWAGTLIGSTEDGITELREKLGHSLMLLIAGREVCPSTGRPHFQIYMELKNPRRLSGLKDINGAIHWEIARKPRMANVKYCTKDGNAIVIDPEGLLDNTSKSYWNGITDLATADPLNFSRRIHAMQHLEGARLWTQFCERFAGGQVSRTHVIYISGPTGSGKTWKAYEIAMENYTPEDISIVEACNSFLNALNIRAKCWIFPEFRPATLEASVFLQILDIYPFVANVKGGHAVVRPEMVIIASIKQPQEIYKEEINVQFRRRITQTIQLSETYTIPVDARAQSDDETEEIISE